MNIKYMQHVVGFLALLLISQMVSAAAVITTTYNGSADFGSGGVGYGSGKIWPNPSHPGSPASLVSVGVGGDNFTTSNDYNFVSDNGSFNTWCVDITHWLSTGVVTYTLGGKTQLDSIFGTTRVGDLQALANERYSGLNNQASSAAFQLATWAIMFGTPDQNGIYNLNSSTFQTSAGITGGALAQSWLNDLNVASNTADLNIIYLYGSTPGSQNLVVFAPVPEPGTYAMMLGGIGLMGFMVRRRKSGEGKPSIAALRLQFA